MCILIRFTQACITSCDRIEKEIRNAGLGSFEKKIAEKGISKSR
jgi:hypothetical protein